MTRKPNTKPIGIPLGWDTEEPPAAAMGFGRSLQRKRSSARRKLIEDASDSHMLLVAPTGAGKARNIIIPTLLHSHAPMVVVDVKGELANSTAKHRAQSMGHAVHIIDPWRITKPELAGYRTSFNPMGDLEPTDPGFADDCFSLAGLFTPPNARTNDPFWNERAEAAIAGVIGMVASVPAAAGEQEPERTLGKVYEHLHGDDLVYSLACKLDAQGKAMHRFAYEQIAAFLGVSADVTRVGIMASFQSLLRPFGSDAIKDSLKDGLDPACVADGRPTTIYLVMPLGKLGSHAALLRLWLSALMQIITGRRKRPPAPTLFIIDEAAQLGHMPQLREAVTLTRGYGVRTMMVLQSPAQLKVMFPVDHDVIVENCGTIISFGLTRAAMAGPMATWLGDVSSERLATLGSGYLALKRGGDPTIFPQRIDMLKDAPFKARLDTNPMFAR
jgi:type IV secretion system protein VirD4